MISGEGKEKYSCYRLNNNKLINTGYCTIKFEVTIKRKWKSRKFHYALRVILIAGDKKGLKPK